MSSKYAVFYFVKEVEPTYELGLVEWVDIVSEQYNLNQLNNSDWNFDTEIKVNWPQNGLKSKKNGKVESCPAKIVCFGDSELTLRTVIQEIVNGKDLEEVFKSPKLGRGLREKKRKTLSSSDEECENSDENTAHSNNSRKVLKKKKIDSVKKANNSILHMYKRARNIENSLQMRPLENSKDSDSDHTTCSEPDTDDERTHITTLKKSNWKLQQDAKLYRQNIKNLTSIIALNKKLPDLLQETENLISKLPDLVQETENLISKLKKKEEGDESFISLKEVDTTYDTEKEVVNRENRSPNTSFITAELLNECSKENPQKFINDIMHGLYDDEYMATHSITGFKRSKSTDEIKDPMDKLHGTMLIAQLQTTFPTICKKESEAKRYIRAKLNNANNASKTIAKKNKIKPNNEVQ